MLNPGQELLLKFDRDKVNISNTKSINGACIDIGPNRTLKPGVNWKISVIKFLPNESRIFAKKIYRGGQLSSGANSGLTRVVQIERFLNP